MEAFFLFKENEIRKAGLTNDSSFDDIRKEHNKLTTLINSISKERNQRLQIEDRQRKINSLKSLPINAKLYLTSNSWQKVPYGTEISKIKDNRKYMTCETPIGRYNIPYSWLNPIQPSHSDIETNRTLVKVFTGIKI